MPRNGHQEIQTKKCGSEFKSTNLMNSKLNHRNYCLISNKTVFRTRNSVDILIFREVKYFKKLIKSYVKS